MDEALRQLQQRRALRDAALALVKDDLARLKGAGSIAKSAGSGTRVRRALVALAERGSRATAAWLRGHPLHTGLGLAAGLAALALWLGRDRLADQLAALASGIGRQGQERARELGPGTKVGDGTTDPEHKR